MPGPSTTPPSCPPFFFVWLHGKLWTFFVIYKLRELAGEVICQYVSEAGFESKSSCPQASSLSIILCCLSSLLLLCFDINNLLKKKSWLFLSQATWDFSRITILSPPLLGPLASGHQSFLKVIKNPLILYTNPYIRKFDLKEGWITKHLVVVYMEL